MGDDRNGELGWWNVSYFEGNHLQIEQGLGKNREEELSWFYAYPFSLNNSVYIQLQSIMILPSTHCQTSNY